MMKTCDRKIGCSILRFYSMLRENISIAFVVDRGLRVLLWSNGLVEATNLAQDTVEGRDLSSLPFLSEENRDNTIAAIRQSFLTGATGSTGTGDEEEGGSKRRMVVALVPGARTPGAAREILLHFTATFYEDHQHVVCLGREMEGALASLLQGAYQDTSEVSSLTSGTFASATGANLTAYSASSDESSTGSIWIPDAYSYESDLASTAGSSARSPAAGGSVPRPVLRPVLLSSRELLEGAELPDLPEQAVQVADEARKQAQAEEEDDPGESHSESSGEL